MKKVFCMGLKTAGIVIGWLGILGSFIISTAMITLLLRSDGFKNNTDGNFLLVMFSFMLTNSLIGFVTSGFLIAGTLKDRHLMLVPWLVQAVIGLVIGTVRCISTIYGLFGAPNSFYISLVLFTLIFLGLQFYIFFVVHSLFKEIREKSIQTASTNSELEQSNTSYYKM